MSVLDKVNKAWYSLLDWLEDKGLPFRSLADSLEEKGVPSLPTAIIALVAIIAILFFTLVGPALAPPTAEVVVFAKTAEGSLIDNATIRLLFEEPCSGAMELVTYEGKATFEGAPASPCPARVIASHYDYDTPEVQALTLQPKESKTVLFTMAPRVPTTVSLAVNIAGPSKARVYLYDSTGNQVDVKEGTTIYFEVTPNATYKLRGEASGYSSETKDVTVGSDSPVETMTLFELGAEKAGTVRIVVADSEGKYGKPIANATVQIFDASTNRVAKTMLTGQNGEVEPQKIAIGKKVYALATANGLLPRKSDTFEVKAGENAVRLNLARSTKDNTYDVAVSVLDESRKAVASPIVRLWKAGERSQELVPADGVARFKVPAGERYTATAYKADYLPNYAGEVSKGDYEIVLEKATELNAGTVKVRVKDAEDADVAGADVALFRIEVLANRSAPAPLGVPEKQTSLSGYALFEDVPLGLVSAKAAFAGRSGESAPVRVTAEGTPGENATLIEIKLAPGRGKIIFDVTDKFSGKPVDGATARATGVVGANENSSAECITKAGKCSLEITEGNVEVTVSGAGYDPYSASVLATTGEQRLEVSLLSVDAAKTTKLEFQGVYDLLGRKVTSLAPSTTYVAKYVLRSPPFAFNSANALVSLGSPDSALASENAAIVGWNAPGARVYAGTGFEAAQPPMPELELPSPSPSPTAAPNATVAPAQVLAPSPSPAPTQTLASVAQAASNAQENKWAYFEFPSFQGSKEIGVQIRTKATAKATVELMHRAAWFTDKEVVRDPADGEAGVTKSELLANLVSSGTLEVSFEGTCEANACLQAWVESEGSTYAASGGFEAIVPTEFRLSFKVFGSTKEATIKLSTGSQAVEITGGSSGANAATITQGEASQDASLRVALSPQLGAGQGYFTISPKVASKDVPMTLTAETADGNRVETLASIRVVHPKPKLVVTVVPKQIQALKQTQVTFRIKDAFDNAIENAHVTLGSEDDALGSAYEAFNSEEATQPKGAAVKQNSGIYRIDGVEAKKTGAAKYVVEAEGFKLAKGEVSVVASKLFEITPEKATLSVDSKLYSTTPLTVRNLLDQEVLVTLSVAKNSIPKYTTVDADTTSIRLKPMETKTVNLRAKVSDAVPDVATKATQVRETVDGYVHAAARIGLASGSGSQGEDVPYSAVTVFNQRALNDLWTVSTENVAVRLEPPAMAFRTEKIIIYNDAPTPILINQMSTLPHVVAEPLSMTIPAGESAELTLHFSALPEYMEQGKCIMEDKRFDVPGLILAASYQGVVSKRQIHTTIDIASSGNCRPDRPAAVALPANALFTFPTGTKVKRNTDGSYAVLVAAAQSTRPSEEQRMLFQPGATVTNSYASVPAGVGIEVTQSLVSYDASKDEYSVSFPAQAALVFGAETKLPSTLSSNARVIVGNQQLMLPAGSYVTQGSPTVLNAPPQPTSISYNYPGWIPPVPTQSYYQYGAGAAGAVGGAAYATPISGLPPYVAYSGMPPYSPSAASMGYYYGSPYSVYDPVQYGYPSATNAMYSYAKQPGSKYVTIAPYSRISIRSLGFDSGEEKTISIPAGISFVLPSDAAVGKDDYDSSYLVTFANGDALKSSQTSAYDKNAKTLRIPANSEWYAPKSWVLKGDGLKNALKDIALVSGEDAFALKLPADSRISYASSVADPYKEAGLWIVEIQPNSKALAFDYEVKPTQVGGEKVIAVDKGKPIVVLYGGSVKSFLLGEALVDAPEAITVPGDFEYLTVKLPANTRFEPDSGAARTAILPDCTRVDVLMKDGKLFKRLPATRKIGFENANYEDRTAVKVSAGNSFTPFLCSAASDEERVQTICFPGPVVVGVPPNSTKGEEGNYNTISIAGCEGVKMTLNSVKPPVSSISFGTTKIKAAKDSSDVFVNTSLGFMMLALRKAGCIDFTVCKDYGKQALSKGAAVWAGLGLFGFVNAALPAVELNNDVRTKKVTFQFYNLAKSDLTLQPLNTQSVRVTPAEYGDTLDYRTIRPSEAWSLSFEKPLTVPPNTAGGKYVAEATVKVPSALLDGQDCIVKSADVNAEVEFVAQESSSSVPYKAKLLIPVKITTAGTCFAKKALDSSAALSGVFVTDSWRVENKAATARTGKKMRAALAFKGIGSEHARPITIVNNRLSDIKTYVGGTGVLECSLDSSGTTLIKDPLEVEVGSSQTVFCWPSEKLAKSIPLDGSKAYNIAINSTEVDTQRTLTTLIRVIVFNPNATALYASTPWGERAPQTATAKIATTAGTSLLASFDEDLSTEQSLIEVPEGSFLMCSAHYCSYEQARDAVADFAVQMQQFLNKTIIQDWPSGALGYCEYLMKRPESKEGEKYRLYRSAVLNVQNVRSPVGFENEVKELLKGKFDEATVTGKLDGCGVYELKAYLSVPCPATQKGFTEKALRERIVIEITKKASCNETVANAALLLPDDKTEVFVGKRLVQWFPYPPSTWEPMMLSKGALPDLGMYGEEDDEHDAKVANAFSTAVFGKTLALKGAADYDNLALCGRNGLRAITTFAAYNGLIRGTISAVTGGGLPGLVKGILLSAERTAVAIDDCVVSAALGTLASATILNWAGAGPGTPVLGELTNADWCTPINWCIEGAMFGYTSRLDFVKEGKGIFAKIASKLKGKPPGQIISAGAEESAGFWSKVWSTLKASWTGAGGTTTSTLSGASDYLGMLSFADVVAGGGTISFAKNVIRVTVTDVEKFAAQVAQATGKDNTVIQIINVVEKGDGKGGSTTTPPSKPKTPRTPRTPKVPATPPTTPATPPTQPPVQPPTAPTQPTQPTTPTQPAQPTKPKIRVADFAEVIAGLLLVTLIDTDVRPVRAELNASLPGHVVVYHLERALPRNLPTMVEACEGSVCSPNFAPMYLFGKHECPIENDVCLRLVGTSKTNDLQGHLLLVAANGKEVDYNKLFESLFVPEAAPITVKKSLVQKTQSLSGITYAEGAVTAQEQELSNKMPSYEAELAKLEPNEEAEGLTANQVSEIEGIISQAQEKLSKASSQNDAQAVVNEAKEKVNQIKSSAG